MLKIDSWQKHDDLLVSTLLVACLFLFVLADHLVNFACPPCSHSTDAHHLPATGRDESSWNSVPRFHGYNRPSGAFFTTIIGDLLRRSVRWLEEASCTHMHW